MLYVNIEAFIKESLQEDTQTVAVPRFVTERRVTLQNILSYTVYGPGSRPDCSAL